MNLDNLNKWLTLVANIGVLAGIVFLAIELQQSNRIAVGTQFHERSALGHENFLSQRENEAFVESQARLWESGFEPNWWNQEIEAFREERNLTMEEIFRQSVSNRAYFVRMNNNYFQYKQGLVSESAWNRNLENMKRRLEDPILKAMAPTIGFLEVDLTELLRDILAEKDSQY